jgi:hypothetical protein
MYKKTSPYRAGGALVSGLFYRFEDLLNDLRMEYDAGMERHHDTARAFHLDAVSSF